VLLYHTGNSENSVKLSQKNEPKKTQPLYGWLPDSCDTSECYKMLVKSQWLLMSSDDANAIVAMGTTTS